MTQYEGPDINTPAWILGHEDGVAGREATSEDPNYVDGYLTGDDLRWSNEIQDAETADQEDPAIPSLEALLQGRDPHIIIEQSLIDAEFPGGATQKFLVDGLSGVVVRLNPGDTSF